MDKMGDTIKRGIRNWLQVQSTQPYAIQIQEFMDFELAAIRNRIWYMGDSGKLIQAYEQAQDPADQYKFWACRPSPGMNIHKIHTGLPGLIVKTLASIVMADMNDFEMEDPQTRELWEQIAKENDFRKRMEDVIKDVLVVGDGAFKITFDTSISSLPILEWYSGEYIEIRRSRGRLKEVIFKTPYTYRGQQYVLYEHCGYGYLRNELFIGDRQVDMKSIPDTENITDWEFKDADRLILAVPLMVFSSAQFRGRGGSIFDGKLDNFDALDEAWSQWTDALRASRAKTYIPGSFAPRNPETGEIIPPNPFDNRYFLADGDMREGQKNVIVTEQPSIPYDGYQATYITALDLCLQGVLSPSTLGIDVKKLDNAEAQREKEKATLYTRNAIVEALQETLPRLVEICIQAVAVLNKQPIKDVQVDISFGEYANPSFESQVETLGKTRPGAAIMSIEAQVEEMWGDSRDAEWKADEVKRLKEESGMAEAEEPGLNTELGDFRIGGNYEG